MADKHEIIDLSNVRRAQEAKPTASEVATARLKGRKFSELSPQDKDDLLMIIGCSMGILAPEDPQH